jgi:hypothetical protein
VTFHVSQPLTLKRLQSSVNLCLNTFINSDTLSRQIQSQNAKPDSFTLL